MPLLRRFTALLSGLLLVQLTLLDGHGSCASRARRQEHAGAAMMQIAHVSGAVAVEPASNDACDTAHSPAACSSMLSCATALTLPTSESTSTTLCPPTVTLPEPVAIHSQPAAAPDAPPPRG